MAKQLKAVILKIVLLDRFRIPMHRVNANRKQTQQEVKVLGLVAVIMLELAAVIIKELLVVIPEMLVVVVLLPATAIRK